MCATMVAGEATGRLNMRVTKDMIDPQLRLAGRVLGRMAAKRFGTVEAVRRGVENPGLLDKLLPHLIPKSKTMQTEERWIPRPDGADMRILIKRPAQPTSGVAGVLHIHGGGYHTGTAELDLHCARHIELSQCIVVSPDYRLSVEEPFPAALDDCYTALLWLKEHASSLGVRDDQIVVTGESAGGGLTAATTMRARDRGEVNVAFQMPLCPMIDDRNDSPSAADNDAPGWNQATNEVGWKLYLGELWGSDDVPAEAAPARATDYAGLPPTYTYVGSLDPFRSETERYVASLRAAGVPAELDIVEGAYHGFEVVKRARVTKRAFADLDAWFERALQQYTAPQHAAGSNG